MLFETPEVGKREVEVVEEIDELRSTLRRYLHEPRRWAGSLRRQSFARAVQGSNSIEGYEAGLDDVAAAIEGEDVLDADKETELALKGYREAMTFVLQLAGDEDFAYSEQLLKSLQFMMTSYDLSKRPGQWRAGAIFVRNDGTGDVVYEGPDRDEVPHLIDELVASLNGPAGDEPVMVRAGMAHLNLVMIHPFRDGNGRMARALQTLVLAREGVLAPVFCSIEEYLGHNTTAYYDVLARVGGGRWQPERDAAPWVRFTLTAHLRQAKTLLRRVYETERLWDRLEHLVAQRRLPDRAIPALFDAAHGFRIRRTSYINVQEAEISEPTATRDLRLLVESGLLQSHGERRGRYYVAGQELKDVWQGVQRARDPNEMADPFERAAKTA